MSDFGYPKGRRMIAWLLIAIALAASSSVASAEPHLNLTDQPVVTGSSLAPNILVAVDDSGSMDFETLFPTDNGLLFWNEANQSFGTGRGYVQNGNTAYAYLFPNGYNGCYNGACQARDRRIYNNYLALPPIPSLGFARDPEFNKAYFNPATRYSPWVGRDPAPPSAAYYDPEVRSATLDLTTSRESIADGETFDFQPGMVLPQGLVYYHTVTTAQGTTTVNNVCYRSAGDYYLPNLLELLFRSCGRYGYVYRASAQVNSGATTSTGFYPADNDRTITTNTSLGVAYFPATFYLEQSTALPAGFGWKSSAPRIAGRGPNGEALYGYEIRPDNFTSEAAYRDAIQNFANWFSYYRKRSLAIRGGITAAFDQIGRVRVGSCTITQAEARLSGAAAGNHYLTMTSLANGNNASNSTRRDFYESIYGLDFSEARGTPNRPALYYLGRELENNPDIIQSPCQRNYALLFTDGYNSGSVSGVGNVDTAYGRSAHSPIPDAYSNTMADIAMRFYQELDPPDHIDSVAALPTPDGCPADESVDCVTRPHMTTFGVTLGQQGYIFDNEAFATENQDPYTHPPAWYLRSSNVNNRFTFGDLPTGGPQEIDDLWHAAINSRGALLNAASPQELASKFSAALNQILGRGESLANAASNSTSLTRDAVIYQTRYQTGPWRGDLIAYSAQSGSTSESGRLWSAAEQLNALSSDRRTVITALRSGNATTGGDIRGIPFRAEALNDAGIEGLDATTIAYLRGNRSQEQQNSGNLRNRGSTVLGDIIHSVPTYVGAPQPLRYAGTWQDQLHPELSPAENTGQAYYGSGDGTSFVDQQTERPPMVYVGANDGMLHGFYAGPDSGDDRHTPGQEWLAYIPNVLLGSLAAGEDALTRPAYIHRSFVDGQMTSAPAYFNAQWHTMLVGSLRNGGNTIYALDITDPTNFAETSAASLVRWEFKAPGLGQTFGKPAIVRLHSGRWAAVFGNGYNSDGYGASLYVVDLADGHQIAHITTGARPSGNESGNGLATPVPADLDGDHITDYIYAGDLYGNVWRFDLTSASPSLWSASRLFQATRNNQLQPITTQIQVAPHPDGLDYGVMLYFGTGQDIEPLDGDATATPNSFYGVWDADVFTYDAPNTVQTRPERWSVQRAQLVTQTVGEIAVDDGVSGLNYRTVSDNPVHYIDGNGAFADRGWVIELPAASGEAVLSDPAIIDDNIQFSTTVINRSSCTLTSSGFFMAVDRGNGGAPQRRLFDSNGDARIDEADTLGVAGIGFGTRGSPGSGPTLTDSNNGTRVFKVPMSNGGATTISVTNDADTGRRSWHEIRR
ncbi:PilC/PilY family type IV pilus protein [Salinisphaera sp. SPP-AMP-43]|uniref:pilus assembly protein n=1 Tax=Salinisphaera sp. SPP-AMP-43 TaxID=3121288 RepID=UPI003C6E9E45